MKIPFLPLSQLVFSIAGFSISLLLPQPSFAQSTQVNPLQDLQPEQTSDPFARTDRGDSFGIFDLIHRATLGSPGSLEEQNLDEAAADFRARQKQRIQQQQQAIPETTVNPPQSDD